MFEREWLAQLQLQTLEEQEPKDLGLLFNDYGDSASNGNLDE